MGVAWIRFYQKWLQATEHLLLCSASAQHFYRLHCTLTPIISTTMPCDQLQLLSNFVTVVLGGESEWCQSRMSPSLWLWSTNAPCEHYKQDRVLNQLAVQWLPLLVKITWLRVRVGKQCFLKHQYKIWQWTCYIKIVASWFELRTFFPPSFFKFPFHSGKRTNVNIHPCLARKKWKMISKLWVCIELWDGRTGLNDINPGGHHLDSPGPLWQAARLTTWYCQMVLLSDSICWH